MNKDKYTMVDIFGLPHCSRIFYLKGSALNFLYEEEKIEEKYPKLRQWIYHMRE